MVSAENQNGIKFFILDQNFNSIKKLDNYTSMMWIDRYNEPGEVEVYLPATAEFIESVQRDNYIWASNSEKLMILEDIEINTSVSEMPTIIARGRSLESILDRRILLYDTVFKENLEDGIRQILDVSLMSHAASDRIIENFIFEYSGDEAVSGITINYEFSKGDNLLDVVTKIVKGAHLGYRLILNNENKFVFSIFAGKDRSYTQTKNPWIIFSPIKNNLSTSNFKSEGAEYKNVVYTYGEEYNNQAPEELIVGDYKGLLRREIYNDASNINHEVEENGKKTTLTAAEYTAQLKQSSDDVLNDNKIKETAECEVDYKIQYEYGRDYFVGDIIQMENEYGLSDALRVKEFITSYSDSGIETYPTFQSLKDEEEDEKE